ncbi:MAG TPA: tRNA (adenosine(37)-N6)-dimethylallyltransferase MiaA [Steroidobacteraceae bacterium]|nr:tRNA (adenosine(37)-N6)-dimethylallyltransferase MiaA [Steroidobacteraceae bacterium]
MNKPEQAAGRPPLPAGIAVLGPTGSGKSALAMQIAAHLPAEIISVDSAQVYRGLDIGTAKPTAEERRAVPHHLIDIIGPEQVYSAGQFRTDALRLVDEITARGRVPLLVGGTMLYFRALFRGIAELPVADVNLRGQLDADAARQGWPALHARLAALDPEAARRIHPNDAQRIQRALEIAALSGQPRDQLWMQDHSYNDFSHWRICVLEPGNRAQLHELLRQRLEQMVQAGLAEEVRQLLARGTLEENAPVLRLVGYRQFVSHVRGQESLEAAVARALAATRQLAKRQLTWLRGDNLLPSGASVLRSDPFASGTKELLRALLIEARKPA